MFDTLRGMRPSAAITQNPGARESGHAWVTAAHVADQAIAATYSVSTPLQPLFPHGGIRPGQWIGVSAPSLLLAVLAQPSHAGAWCAIVGVEGLGLAAVRDAGVALERVVVIPRPGPRWGEVVAALVDTFDVVAIRLSTPVPTGIARRLQARVRQRGAIMIVLHSAPSVIERLTIDLQIVEEHWEGIGHGHGALRARRVRVAAQERDGQMRRRPVSLWLPAPPEHVEQLQTAPSSDGVPLRVV